MEDDLDPLVAPREGLIDGVVDDLVDEVVEATQARRADCTCPAEDGRALAPPGR